MFLQGDAQGKGHNEDAIGEGDWKEECLTVLGAGTLWFLWGGRWGRE